VLEVETVNRLYFAVLCRTLWKLVFDEGAVISWMSVCVVNM